MPPPPPHPLKLVTSRIDSFRLLYVKLGYRYGGRLNVPLISSDKSYSSTSSNKTEKKTLKEIMDSCQNLDILIVVCTITSVLQILCLCLLKKTRNIPSSRLYEDTHDLIRKPARILYGKIIGQCAVAYQQKQPIQHDAQPF